jgi:uncharacterized cupin superfamily protein
MGLFDNVLRTSAIEWQGPAQAPPRGFDWKSKRLRDRIPLGDLGAVMEWIPPGARSAPLHDHLFEEEQFYVLAGTLTVHERLPDGARREYELRAGELVAYVAGTRIAHQFVNRSHAPATFFAISDRHPGDICTYPDSDKTNLRSVRVTGSWSGRKPGETPGEEPSSSARMAEARERRAREVVVGLGYDERPPYVASIAEDREIGAGERRFFGAPLSREAGAKAVFVNRDRLPVGSSPSRLHRHVHNEELLYVLEGSLTLRQRDGDVEGTTTLEPGDLVHWAPRTVAHQIRNDGDHDAIYLVAGTDRPWDVIELPETDERFVAALGELGTLEPLDYWAGEER